MRKPERKQNLRKEILLNQMRLHLDFVVKEYERHYSLDMRTVK